MNKGTCIINRFSPDSNNPIFFIGRQYEITEYYFLLQNFIEKFSSDTVHHIYTIKGKNGIGKTTFLNKLKKEVTKNSCHYLPIYLSILEIIDSPSNFSKIILSNLETAFLNSLNQRDKLIKFLKTKRWHHEAISVSPALIPVTYKLSILELSLYSKDTYIIKSFFNILKEIYTTNYYVREMFLFINWLLEKTDLFIFFELDDLEKADGNINNLIVDILNEISKPKFRYFTIIGIKTETFTSLQKKFEKRYKSGIISILQRTTFVNIKEKEDILEKVSYLKKLPYMENFFIINISPELDVTIAARAIKGQYASQFLTNKFSVEKEQNIVQFIKTIGLNLFAQVKQALKDTSENYSFDEDKGKTKKIKNQLSSLQTSDLEMIFAQFKELLLRLDKNLEKIPNLNLVIFLENLEKILFSSFVSIVKAAKTIPFSFTFIKFFHFLNNCNTFLNRISIVIITKLPELYERNRELINFLNQYVTELQPLPEDDSIALLQEIAARSGVDISKNIAMDIHIRTKGIPFFLHYYGFYLLDNLDKNISNDEKVTIKEHLLKKTEIQKSHLTTKLKKSLDKRIRINLDPKFYNLVVPTSFEDLYKKIFAKQNGHIAQKMLLMLSKNVKAISKEEIYSKISQYYKSEMPTENMNSTLFELEQNKFIRTGEGGVNIIHPCVTTIFENLEELQKRSFSRKTKFHSEVKPQIEDVSEETVDDRTVQVLSNQELTKRVNTYQPSQNFMNNKIDELKKGIFPNEKDLNQISSDIELNEQSPRFAVSLRYIYFLCWHIKNKLELEINVKTIFSIFKEYLLIKGTEPDLYYALTKTLFGRSGLLKHSKEIHLLTKFYFLRYQMTGNIKDLEEAIEQSYNIFIQFPVKTNLSSLFSDAKRSLSYLQQNEKIVELTMILEWTNKLILMQDSSSYYNLGKKIEKFMPSSMPEKFQPYFLKFLGKLIEGQTYFIGIAIEMLGFFGPAIENHLDLLNLLEECFNKETMLTKSITKTLLKLLPYLKKEDGLEIMQMFQENLLQGSNVNLRRYIFTKISEYFPFIDTNDFASFCYGLVSFEQNAEIKAVVWSILARVHHYCSEDMKHELTSFLVSYYSKLIQQNDIDYYTNLLLNIIHTSPDNLHQIGQLIIDGLPEINSKNNINKAIILNKIFPFLPKSQKHEITTILKEWLDSHDTYKELFAIDFIDLYYENLLANTQDLKKVAISKFSLQQKLMNKNFVNILDKLGLESRSYIWEDLFNSLTLTNPIHNALEYFNDSFINNLETLMKIACFFSDDKNENIAKILIQLLQNKKTYHILSQLGNLDLFIPYIEVKSLEKIQDLIFKLIATENVCDEMVKVALKLYSIHPNPNLKVQASLLLKIRERMNRNPEMLLDESLKFFSIIKQRTPDELVKSLYKDSIYYLNFYNYAESAVAFLLHIENSLPNCKDWAYYYQFNSKTCHVAFTLYEMFSKELVNVKFLQKNYERMKKNLTFLLALKMAHFYMKLGIEKRANELLNWSLEYSKSNLIKMRALQQKLEWLLLKKQGKEAKQILQKIAKLKTDMDA